MNCVESFQIHHPVFNSLAWISHTGFRVIKSADFLSNGGVLETLQKLKEDRLFCLTGMTTHGDTEAYTEVIRIEGFDSALVYYNLLNPCACMEMSQKRSGYDSVEIF